MPLIGSIFSTWERIGGKPRELYTFAAKGQMWHYTSSAKPISLVYSGTTITWDPADVSRAKIQRTKDNSAIAVHVRVARITPVAQFLLEEHTAPLYLGIHRHQNQTGALPVLVAFGTCINLQDAGDWLEFDLQTNDIGLGKPFPRLKLQTTCPLTTYGHLCGVGEQDFSHNTTLLSVDRATIIVNDLQIVAGNPAPDGWYDGGQIVWQRERVYVLKQVATTFTIIGKFPTGYTLGDTVTIIAGDDHVKETCKTKFGNVKRFRGFPWLPVKDPFQSGLR